MTLALNNRWMLICHLNKETKPNEHKQLKTNKQTRGFGSEVNR